MRTSVKTLASALVIVTLSACGTTRQSPAPIVGRSSAKDTPAAIDGNASRPTATASAAPTEKNVDDPAARMRFDAALTEMKSGNPAAQTTFSALAQDFPGLSGPNTNLGIMYARAGKLDEARNAFVQATTADPGNFVAWTWLGSILRQMKHLRESEVAYRHALEAKPDYASAHLNLAILYELDLRSPDKAATEYQAYIKLVPARAIVSVWLHDLKPMPSPTVVAGDVK